jgi:pyridoxine 4-dehydrogenase
MSRRELTQAVHDNLRNLGVDVLEVVNLRSMLGNDAPTNGSIAEPLAVLADLQRQGLVRHIGLSNVTPGQVAEGQRICEIVCVQNLYNLANRGDDALVDRLARDGIAYVAYWPLGGTTLSQNAKLSEVARLSAPHRCRSPLPGCCSARPISCQYPARRLGRICARTLLRHIFSFRRAPLSN